MIFPIINFHIQKSIIYKKLRTAKKENKRTLSEEKKFDAKLKYTCFVYIFLFYIKSKREE